MLLEVVDLEQRDTHAAAAFLRRVVAGGDVAGTLLFETRRELATEIGRERTSPGKDAALDPLLEAGHLSGNLGEALRSSGEGGAELGHRAEQALRIGMTGRAEQFGHRRFLDLAPGIHDHDALGDFGDDAEIMGDQDDRGTDAALEIQHQLQDLRLDRHVERRGRLVGDQEFRVAGERHGDHHALAHAAGELMWIFAHAPRRLRDANQCQHLDGARLRGLPVEPLMQAQRLADLPADAQHRIEARHRLLEDHRNVVAADACASRGRKAAADPFPESGQSRRSCPGAPGSAA